MRTRLLIPFFVLLLLGAGCALSSADKDRQVSQMMDGQAAAFLPEDAEAAPMVLADESSDDVKEDAPDATLLATPRSITIKVGNFFFEPKAIHAKPGEQIQITFAPDEGTHTFVMDEANVKESITPGASILVTVPMTPGHYTYYSDVGADKTLGMEGEMIVE